MSVSHRLISVSLSSSSPCSLFNLTLLSHHRQITSSSSSALLRSSLLFRDSLSASPMPRSKGNGRQQQWKVNSNPSESSPLVDNASDTATESIADRLGELSVADGIHFVPAVHVWNASPVQHSFLPGEKVLWNPKSYGTARGTTTDSPKLEGGTLTKDDVASASEKQNAALSNLFGGSLLENFTVDSSTYSQAQIRATFYPKFENEKSNQEIRIRMIEMVSKGLATMEVSLKHSGSLLMYSGHNGGAYAKNSFGNIYVCRTSHYLYTSVGVFVLGRMLKEAWGVEANRKQAEFNEFLERNRMCISMELVTAVLGDHGQRPREDYVVVTAVTELENKKPRFYSTPEIIAFCRKWRLRTNHVWLFSTRKSVTSFFAAFDALCEEGTAKPVCKALDEVADISIPGSKDHVKVQGEILEGLVARIVSCDSSKHMEEVLRDYPLSLVEDLSVANLDLGPNVRDICPANRSDEKQQIKALLESVGTSFCPDTVDWFGKGSNVPHSRNADRSVLTKFLQAHPADYSTAKLQA